eukprot:COSAG05_NODE_379_length_10567_cov_18.553687_6_plen_73_part_00
MYAHTNSGEGIPDERSRTYRKTIACGWEHSTGRRTSKRAMPANAIVICVTAAGELYDIVCNGPDLVESWWRL